MTRQTAAEERAAYDIVTLRDEGRCVRCRRYGRSVQRDHRQNRDGLNTTPANVQLLCGPGAGESGCHEWKTTHPKDAIAEGWSCPRWAKPEEFPARRWVTDLAGVMHAVWVLYDLAGDWREIDALEAHARIRGDWPGVAIAGDR